MLSRRLDASREPWRTLPCSQWRRAESPHNNGRRVTQPVLRAGNSAYNTGTFQELVWVRSTDRNNATFPGAVGLCAGYTSGVPDCRLAVLAGLPDDAAEPPIRIETLQSLVNRERSHQQYNDEPAVDGGESVETYDAIIIGSGQAGPSLAKRLAGTGRHVAIIERGAFGGTCINTGCTPTKTLVASAYAAHMARRAAEFGVVIGGGVTVDMRRVKQRKDEIVASWSAATEASLRATENCAVHRGHARFVAAHELEVGGERLTAQQVFINVGGRAAVPPVPGIDSVPYLTNSTVLGLDDRAAASDHTRRQLHRTGVRADLPPLRRGGFRYWKPHLGWCRARMRRSLPRSAASWRAKACASSALYATWRCRRHSKASNSV